MKKKSKNTGKHNDRYQQMKKIRDELIAFHDSPLYKYRTTNEYYPVIGEGNHNAKIMFIGEAPGENEAKTARPFCGAAGRILDELLASIDLKREDVYITNILKDRPPGNRDPLPDEIEVYTPFLIRQINIIQPRVIATLGRFSMKFIMELCHLEKESAMPISSTHGKTFIGKCDYGDVSVIPLYHPAVVLYKATMKDQLIEDFKALTVELAFQ